MMMLFGCEFAASAAQLKERLGMPHAMKRPAGKGVKRSLALRQAPSCRAAGPFFAAKAYHPRETSSQCIPGASTSE